MINQAKAIFFILLANITLLAHSFIPHQHVNGFAIFESHHTVHHNDRDHITNGHHHNETDHDEDEDHKPCNLKLTFFFLINTPKCEYKYVDYFGKSIPDYALPFNYERLVRAIQPFLTLNPTPDLNSFYYVYLIQCFGLRAHPLA